MTTQEKQHTLFVGIDVHKHTHTAVALSPFGETLGEITIGNHQQDFNALVTTMKSIGQKHHLSPRFGLEDCTNYGTFLATYLCRNGYPVTHIPPVMVDRQRKRATHPEKSDSLDALGVAKVMITEVIDKHPIYTIPHTGAIAQALRELVSERHTLVQERVRMRNQLHRLLYRIFNTAYEQKFKNPFSKKALRYWSRCRPNHDPHTVAHMKRLVRRLRHTTEAITAREQDLKALLANSDTTLPSMSGCGPVVASTILGEVGDIRRFRSPGHLAKYAGCVPREHSSGKRSRHYKDRSGNRRLNGAFYRLALCQISRSGNPAARRYFLRKIAEGKSKSQAISCLKRQLVTVVWMLLKHNEEYRWPV